MYDELTANAGFADKSEAIAKCDFLHLHTDIPSNCVDILHRAIGLYLGNKRTAIGCVNSRLDNLFGFEKHTIRELKKMTFKVMLAQFLMPAFAVAMSETGSDDKIMWSKFEFCNGRGKR